MPLVVMTMMDKEERYRAMQWFAAGYLTGESAEPVHIHAQREENARIVAKSYIEKYREGQCLDCGRQGVVLVDGMFCERCHYPVGEVMDDDGT